jgi:hypothetical protein
VWIFRVSSFLQLITHLLSKTSTSSSSNVILRRVFFLNGTLNGSTSMMISYLAEIDFSTFSFMRRSCCQTRDRERERERERERRWI